MGCTRNNPKFEKTVSVRGTVILASGAPLTGGLITFHPKDLTKGEARGTIGNDGRFEMGTYGKSDGVMLGTYTVTVEKMVYDKAGNIRPARYLHVPQKYTSADSSDLTVEIKDEGAEDMKLLLR
jgi:hypothetical protein